MKYRIDVYSGTYAGKIPDGNPVAIQKDTIHVDLHVIPQMDIFSVIGEKRGGDPNVFSPRTDPLIQYLRNFFQVVRRSVVVFFLQAFGFVPSGEEFRVGTVVR